MQSRLTHEQEFDICSFNQQVEYLTEAEIKEALLRIHRQMIDQQNYYQQKIKKAWLIG